VSAWADEVKARGVASVATALGLEVRRGGPGSLTPCPACQAPQRGSTDRRGPVGLTRDGLGWRCHRCQASGNAVDLAALVSRGTVPSTSDKAGWRDVATFCEAHGFCTPSTPGTTPSPRPRAKATPPPPAPPPAPPPVRPPEAEVRALWEACGLVTEDADVCAWLEARALDPTVVAERELVRALPLTGSLPRWCCYSGRGWRGSSHRVIVPLYGPGGRLESLHARAVNPATPKKDKAASPKDAEVRGLVMADAGGRLLLEGTAPPGARQVLVTEGVPDFLTWATRFGDAAEDAPPVLGVIAGSWSADIAATIPRGWTVIIHTHNDKAGNKYAATIHASVAGRNECKRRRSHPSTYVRTGVVHDA